MRQFVIDQNKALAPASELAIMAHVTPYQLRSLIRVYTTLSVTEAERQPPPVFSLGEADAIYLAPILRVAEEVQKTIKFMPDGTIDMTGFIPGSVIMNFMDMGTTANASVVYIQNMRTKSEMDYLSFAQTMMSQFGKDVPPKIISDMQKHVYDMMTNSDLLLQWLGATPRPTFATPTVSLSTELLKAILEHGGIGFTKQVGINGVPILMAKRQAILQLVQTLMKFDISWMDGYALFLAYQSFVHLTKDAQTYDTYFQRITSPTPAAAAANHARLAQTIGYHFLTLSYAPISLLYMFNHSLLMSELNVLRKFHKFSKQEDEVLAYAQEDYDLYSVNFSFNVVKTLHSKIMQSLKMMMGTDTIISSNLRGLLGNGIAAQPLVVQNHEVRRTLRGPIPQVMSDVPYDKAHYVKILTDLVQRLSNTVLIISGALQLSAVAGTELNANALQLPADAMPIPEADSFDLSLIINPSIDNKTLLSLTDKVDSYSAIPSLIHPLRWTRDEKGQLSVATTIIDEILYSYINTSTFNEALIVDILNRPAKFKWPPMTLPISGLPVTPYAKAFIPFNYTYGYEASKYTAKQMKKRLPMWSSSEDRPTRTFIEETYNILNQTDHYGVSSIADGLLSLGLLYSYSAVTKTWNIVKPTIPFAYGLHISVYLAKMNLPGKLTDTALHQMLKNDKIQVFANNTDSVTDDVWIKTIDPSVMPYIIIPFTHLPEPMSCLYMTGILNHTAFLPIPVATIHFGQKSISTESESVRFTSDWLIEAFDTLMTSWRGDLGDLAFRYGKTILDLNSIKWDVHQGWSKHMTYLPHLSFKVEGGPESLALTSTMKTEDLFTKHYYHSQLPYQKYVISKRHYSLIIFEEEDYQVLRDNAYVPDSTFGATIAPRKINTPASNGSVDSAESLLATLSPKDKTPVSITVNSSINVPPDTQSTSTEKIESAISLIGLEGATIIPPTVDKKEFADQGKIDRGLVKSSHLDSTTNNIPVDAKFVGQSTDEDSDSTNTDEIKRKKKKD